jgi:hypothetical protein
VGKTTELSLKIPKYYLNWCFNLPRLTYGGQAVADKGQLKVIRARQDSYT